jgi:hypothetical protein
VKSEVQLQTFTLPLLASPPLTSRLVTPRPVTPHLYVTYVPIVVKKQGKASLISRHSKKNNHSLNKAFVILIRIL